MGLTIHGHGWPQMDARRSSRMRDKILQRANTNAVSNACPSDDAYGSADTDADSVEEKRGRGRPVGTKDATVPTTNVRTAKKRRIRAAVEANRDKEVDEGVFEAIKRQRGTHYRGAFIEQLLAAMLKFKLKGDEHGQKFANMNRIYVRAAYDYSCRESYCRELWVLYKSQEEPLDWLYDEYLPGLIKEEERKARYCKFKSSCYAELDTYIQTELVEKGIGMSGEAVSELIRDNFTTADGAPIKMSPQACRLILNKLGYAHTHKLRRRIRLTSKRIARIELFLREYHAALLEQEAGDAIVVSTDESYVHTRHSKASGWEVVRDSIASSRVNGVRVESESGQSKSERSGDQYNSRGQRLIMIAAITMFGLLAPLTDSGLIDPQFRPKDENDIDMKTSYKHSAWVFRADARPKDYHKNMDSHMFERWVEYQLLPAFEHCYPGKRMILFLDNAPYHWATDCGFDVNKLNKAKADDNGNSLISIAEKYGMTQFTAGDATYTAPYATRGAPNAIILRKGLMRHLKKNHPGLLKPNVQKKTRGKGPPGCVWGPLLPQVLFHRALLAKHQRLLCGGAQSLAAKENIGAVASGYGLLVRCRRRQAGSFKDKASRVFGTGWKSLR